MNLTPRVQYGGVLVVLSGCGITRSFVAEAVRVDVALAFLLAGPVPLIVGLALTVYGVALAVGPFTDDYATIEAPVRNDISYGTLPGLYEQLTSADA